MSPHFYPLPLQPPLHKKKKKNKIKRKVPKLANQTTEQQQKKISAWKQQCGTVNHTAHPLDHTALFVMVHGYESLA